MSPCYSEHGRMKRTTADWTALPFVGVQTIGDGEPDIELRNCDRGCGSTLAKEVARDR